MGVFLFSFMNKVTGKIFINSICFYYISGQVIQQTNAASYFRSQLWGQVDKHIESS